MIAKFILSLYVCHNSISGWMKNFILSAESVLRWKENACHPFLKVCPRVFVAFKWVFWLRTARCFSLFIAKQWTVCATVTREGSAVWFSKITPPGVKHLMIKKKSQAHIVQTFEDQKSFLGSMEHCFLATCHVFFSVHLYTTRRIQEQDVHKLRLAFTLGQKHQVSRSMKGLVNTHRYARTQKQTAYLPNYNSILVNCFSLFQNPT